MHMIGVNAFFNFGSSQDAKDSTHEIAKRSQGGLGMPDRDYYTKTDDASKKLQRRICRSCDENADAAWRAGGHGSDDAKKIMALETSLAQASRTRVNCATRRRITTKWTQTSCRSSRRIGIGAITSRESACRLRATSTCISPISSRPSDAAFTSTSIDDWKTYLRWHLINAAASELSNDFVNEDFNFNGTDSARRPRK